MSYDVVIVGGGPGGLAAALALARARRRVLLCDGGPRRNAAASHIHNFVTRDGTPPEEFRRSGRDQLARYQNVEVRDGRVASISGTQGTFRVGLGSETVEARIVLLCTGMIDEMVSTDGFRELWGRSIFQCPYCHGWEHKDRKWGYMPRATDTERVVPFALQALGWTPDVTLFTSGGFDLSGEARTKLESAGVRLETGKVARFVRRDGRLEAVELSDGSKVRCDVLFTHPPQQQVELVRSLGVELDDEGYVKVDPMKRETSVAGVYAAGDLTTRMQAAIHAAAAGTQAAAMINVALAMDSGKS